MCCPLLVKMSLTWQENMKYFLKNGRFTVFCLFFVFNYSKYSRDFSLSWSTTRRLPEKKKKKVWSRWRPTTHHVNVSRRFIGQRLRRKKYNWNIRHFDLWRSGFYRFFHFTSADGSTPPSCRTKSTWNTDTDVPGFDLWGRNETFSGCVFTQYGCNDSLDSRYDTVHDYFFVCVFMTRYHRNSLKQETV